MPAIIKKNVVYAGGSGDSSKTISYADYLNLPESEKTMGIAYYIPDYPGESRYVVLSGITPSEKQGSTLIDYPEGYNKDNTMILGVMFQGIQDGCWYDIYGPTKNDIFTILQDSAIAVYMPTDDPNMMNRPIRIAISRY